VTCKPPKGWPSKGLIEFKDVAFRYRPGLAFVLHGVSFNIKGGEKVGVCGRTGAGKTSLLYALFRLVELDAKLQPFTIDIDTGMPVKDRIDETPNRGKILIDGIDISTLPLQLLRRSIAIIPQDPTFILFYLFFFFDFLVVIDYCKFITHLILFFCFRLFVGSLRYNLDLCETYTDEEMWEALDMVEMRQTIIDISTKSKSDIIDNDDNKNNCEKGDKDNNNTGLDFQVADEGTNFSCGQRQLLCLARALLNKSCKIIVLDEATANVDYETDSKIQKTIHEHFGVGKTVIVIGFLFIYVYIYIYYFFIHTFFLIAHRLNTIIGLDKIMVMNEGCVKEFDSPENLIANKSSLFNSLLQSTQQTKYNNE
jgi:ABC-type multidrug transport system fused ATPase/permease subunit